MAADIRGLIDRHHISYDVSPYYVEVVVQKEGAPTRYEKVQAGFEIDLYSAGDSPDVELAPGSEQFQRTLSGLQEVAQAIHAQPSDSQIVEIFPDDSDVYLSGRHNFRPEALLRIRIAHSGELNQPAGPAETKTLEALVQQLQALGMNRGLGSSLGE